MRLGYVELGCVLGLELGLGVWRRLYDCVQLGSEPSNLTQLKPILGPDYITSRGVNSEDGGYIRLWYISRTQLPVML